MGFIQDYVRRLREKKRHRVEYEEDQHMVNEFHQKKVSSNERELMRYQEEERQKRIKQMLKAKRKEENDKIWSGKEANSLYAPNVIAGQKGLFSGKNMFAHTPNVASQPNVVNQPNVIKSGNIFNRKDNMFKGGV